MNKNYFNLLNSDFKPRQTLVGVCMSPLLKCRTFETGVLYLWKTNKQSRLVLGRSNCGLLLDLSKAFDTVDHPILFEKLNNFGVRGIAVEWFKSSNRVQYVSTGSVSSDKISCGVPQGSGFGPLLLLLYINGFHNCPKSWSPSICRRLKPMSFSKKSTRFKRKAERSTEKCTWMALLY